MKEKITEFDRIALCKKCNLHKNQKPLLDLPLTESPDVIWVGLSAVRVNDKAQSTPLSKDTNSGKLICNIESGLRGYQFYKTNLVKCPPLSTNKKIRYPTKGEMSDCFHNFKTELEFLNPKVVFLLGKQVSNFVFSWYKLPKITTFNQEFDYDCVAVDNKILVPVHHPSYILIYRRKKVNNYIEKISNLIKSRV